MKRYLLPVVFTLAVVALYHFVKIRLFSLDLTRRTREALFVLRDQPEIDQNIVLFNIGELRPDKLESKLDSLLITAPYKVGINLCHFERIPDYILHKYQSDDRIVFANCGDSGPGVLSEVIGDHNVVTHFKTDKPDYFEMKLAAGKPRGNSLEMIHFGPAQESRGHVDLDDTQNWFSPEYLAGKTLLVGYMGDPLADEIEDFTNCRTTPLNRFYNRGNVPPDMFDIEISANIIRTLNSGDYINEVSLLLRVMILVAVCLLSVVVLTFVKTRWTILNLVIATVLFIVLTGAAALIIMLAFQRRYYLNLDELPLVLLGTTILTIILNMIEQRKAEDLISVNQNEDIVDG